MKRRFVRFALTLTVAWLLWDGPAAWAQVTLTVGVAEPAHAISPRLYGVFFEDINFGADGGLNAELVKNGSFEFPQPLMGWSEIRAGDAGGELQTPDDDPVVPANPRYLRLKSTGSGYGVVNDGFRGIGVQAAERYRFSAKARSKDALPIGLRIALVAENGNRLADVRIDEIGSDWSEMTAVLQPNRADAKARLVITSLSPGTIDLDLVSLCPERTWKNRPHGLRADLVQLLADLKPAFVRFPGGCIVEGSQLKYRYQWKNTIGDRAERHLIINRWNREFAHRLTPDYFQSFGLGFYEFFQLAEDIGAEPLPILNCGMACQFNSGELVPLEELGPYVQDALDLIEFANGPASSPWGAKRAALGHREPFGMKLLGVGNEQWGPQYFERYEIFAKALKERHPEIELVSGAGPFPGDKNFQFAWPLLRGLKADIVDEHCYAMPDWFLRSATRYDHYDRTGPKVFMGEYAAQSVDICSPDNRNNLRCALAEAAYMTGLERNSDVVVMSSYAPLFGHEEAWQWRPNLIWFDNLQAYATPNYYVQQLFSRNRGDEVLPVALKDPRPADPPAGRIGLGANGSSVEFANIQVTRDGEVIFTGESLNDLAEATKFRGRWDVREHVVRQTDATAVARILFGDCAWRDCTLTLKARKVSGKGGIVIIFRNGSGGSYLQWNLGGKDNKQFSVQANLASHSEDMTIVDEAARSIEPDRWYDVKIELRGSRVRCFLDGALLHDLQIPPPALPRLFATASRDNQSGDVILKVVNPTDDQTDATLKLDGKVVLVSPAHATVLHGKPEDENDIDHPDNVTPVQRTFEVQQPQFDYAFLPNSLTILRLGVK